MFVNTGMLWLSFPDTFIYEVLIQTSSEAIIRELINHQDSPEMLIYSEFTQFPLRVFDVLQARPKANDWYRTHIRTTERKLKDRTEVSNSFIAINYTIEHPRFDGNPKNLGHLDSIMECIWEGTRWKTYNSQANVKLDRNINTEGMWYLC